MNLPLFDFATSNPWLTAWLAWPVASALICAAWFVAEVVTRGFNTLVYIANLISNTIVLCIRGYAPQSAEAAGVDADEPPTT